MAINGQRLAFVAESLVIYYSRKPGIGCSAVALTDGRIVYVRAELHNCDPVTALDRAEPRVCETVVNSVEL